MARGNIVPMTRQSVPIDPTRPILTAARLALADGAVGTVDAVVVAAARLVADASVVGRTDDPWCVLGVLEDPDGTLWEPWVS